MRCLDWRISRALHFFNSRRDIDDDDGNVGSERVETQRDTLDFTMPVMRLDSTTVAMLPEAAIGHGYAILYGSWPESSLPAEFSTL
mmetsp:Transcript_29788/g.54063  ORF Transcript_29788/g.54063 Transcript_29788/m.54063 type:complete len:86 (-) Transcript_29788:22-279(-)